MNISSASSSSCACQTEAPNGRKQGMQDFKALQKALQSGDIDAAKKAFEAFQKDLQASATNSSKSNSKKLRFDPDSQVGKDFQAVSDALSSGDITAAQTAFATFKKDLKASFQNHGAAGAGRAHHHHHDDDGDADDGGSMTTTTTPTPTTTQTVGANLNLTA